MNTCKTCRHWIDDPGSGMCHPADPDTFDPMVLLFQVRMCKHPAQGFCEAPTRADGFSLADGSNYKAVLATGEDFGCPMHEAAG